LPGLIWHSTGQALHSILPAAMRSLRGAARQVLQFGEGVGGSAAGRRLGQL